MTLHSTVRRTIAGAAFIAATAIGPASADAPVAIIEDINAPSTKLQLMDYLDQGQSFALRQGESITISYFDSCSVETIDGGRVKIGLKRSRVTGGKVSRQKVPCGGGGIVLTERQSDQAAGIVFRSLEFSDKAPVTVYSVSPLFVFSNPTTELVIERSDGKADEVHTLKVSGKRLDLADLKVKLTPGATYTAAAGDATADFKVAVEAKGSTASIISRLIGL